MQAINLGKWLMLCKRKSIEGVNTWCHQLICAGLRWWVQTMFDHGRQSMKDMDDVGKSRSISTRGCVKATDNDCRPRVTSLTCVCRSQTINIAHVWRRSTFICRIKAIWVVHVCLRLTLVYKKKKMQEYHIRHWMTVVFRTNATREGLAQRRMTVVQAKGWWG